MGDDQGISGNAAPQGPQPLLRDGEPRVTRFRQTLLWPLGMTPPDMGAKPESDGHALRSIFKLLRIPGGADNSAGEDRPTRFVDTEVQRIARAIEAQAGGPWQSVRDGLAHVPDGPAPPKDAKGQTPLAYAEFVYFHDFVSSFLFPHAIPTAADKSSPIPAFYLFSRADLKTVSVVMWVNDNGKQGEKTFDGKVERTNLYLFRTGVAMLAIEVLFEAPVPADIPDAAPALFSIDDVLALSDAFRRAYVPYFFDEKAEKSGHVTWTAGGVPNSVTWNKEGRTHTKPSLDETRAASVDRENGNERTAPLLPQWRALLPEALVLKGDDRPQGHNLPTFRHLIDERMPLLSHIELERKTKKNRKGWDVDDKSDRPLKRISAGQYMRLCFVDGPGGLSAIDQDDRSSETSVSDSESNPEWQDFTYSGRFLSFADFEQKHCYDRFFDDGTRYLISPYSFIAIGSGFYFGHTLVHHVRRMYFQIFMLAQFEFASLISFSARVSDAIQRNDQRGARLAPEFREEMLTIQEDFIAFVHRFRFTGISNQIQARELHQKIRESLDLQGLFEDVKTEVEMGASHLRARESAEQTDASGRLSVVLGLGAIIGLALTFAQLVGDCFWLTSVAGFGFLLFLCVGTWVLMQKLVPAGGEEPAFNKTARNWLIRIGAVSALFLVALYALPYKCPDEEHPLVQARCEVQTTTGNGLFSLDCAQTE